MAILPIVHIAVAQDFGNGGPADNEFPVSPEPVVPDFGNGGPADDEFVPPLAIPPPPSDSGSDDGGAVAAAPAVAAPAPAPVSVPAPVPAPAAPSPAPAPVLAAANPLQSVSVQFPGSLFLRSAGFPDDDCIRPGESAIMAVKVRNEGRSSIRDLKFTASVPELGIWASDGPITLKTDKKPTRLLNIDVPADTLNGEYYVGLTITNNKFSRTVYRTFVVSSSC